VAWDDDSESVSCAEGSGSALCTRVPRKSSQIAVRDNFAVRHAPQRTEHIPLEGSPPVEFELDVVEGDLGSGEIRNKPVDELLP